MTGAVSRSDPRDAASPAGRATSGGPQRLAGRALIVSGIVAAAGVVFLVAMFASFALGARNAGLPLGRINDVLVLVAYALAAPAVIAVRAILRPRIGRWGDLLALVGLVAIAAVVVLQALLVTDRLTFEQQIGPVSVALLVLGGWFIAVGWIGSATGLLQIGARLGLLAALYVGYPIWAIRLGRRLVTGAGASAQNHVDAD